MACSLHYNLKNNFKYVNIRVGSLLLLILDFPFWATLFMVYVIQSILLSKRHRKDLMFTNIENINGCSPVA